MGQGRLGPPSRRRGWVSPSPACGLVWALVVVPPPACGWVSVLSHSIRKRQSKQKYKVCVLPIAYISMLMCCKINVFETTLKSSYSQYECTGLFLRTNLAFRPISEISASRARLTASKCSKQKSWSQEPVQRSSATRIPCWNLQFKSEELPHGYLLPIPRGGGPMGPGPYIHIYIYIYNYF